MTATVRAPFQLTPKEAQELEAVLLKWQQHSQQIKSFTCSLKRWERDDVFQKTTIGVGDLKYSAPDNGLYRVKDEKTGEMLDHWVCDGQSIYEFNYPKKEVIQRILPANMRGQAIADGPLPFIFGADAAKLKQRYWMRLREPPKGQEGKICIEAFPRTQQDAANFRRAELLLAPESMLPYALQIDLTNGKNWTVHQFYSIVTNDPLRGIKNIFDAPRVFPPWKKILDNPETVAPEAAGGVEQAQAAPRTLPK
jgi:TIGR03009 family protein